METTKKNGSVRWLIVAAILVVAVWFFLNWDDFEAGFTGAAAREAKSSS
jgi:hypothetical protein